MPRQSVDLEEELKEKLEAITPEHQFRTSLIDEAMVASGAVKSSSLTPEISSAYDEQLLKLIDSVTME